MLSSLEVLDAADTLNAAPAVRQGAFQPKAKLRVRKKGAAPMQGSGEKVVSNTATSKQKDNGETVISDTIHAAASKEKDNGEKVIPHTVHAATLKETKKASQVAIFDATAMASASQPAVEFAATEAEHDAEESVQDAVLRNAVGIVSRKNRDHNQGEEQLAAEISTEADGANERVQEAVVGNTLGTMDRKNKERNQAEDQSAAEVVTEADGAKESAQEVVVGNEVGTVKRKNRDRKLAKKQPALEVETGADIAKESGQEAVVGIPSETMNRRKRGQNQAEGQQDVGGTVSSHAGIRSPSRETNKRKRKKPARFADSTDDDDEVYIDKASTEGASKPSKKNRRNDSPGKKRQDNAENDFATTVMPKSPKEEITKVKKRKLASFSATGQPGAEVADEANDAGKSVPPVAEKSQKKKFKKCMQSRRRVERRVMGPIDPDMDPKKMTMKDIIRLAEAKEKLLKKGSTKKAKDGTELTANVPEKEHESLERTCLAPQVQIIDGRIVINQESLTVSAHPKDDIRTYKRVEETHAKLNYHSYMKRTPKQLWQKHETELFYQALREFGTNFAMIQHLFPGRTRKQVLLKYKKEEKVCPLRVSEAMRIRPCETSHFMEILSSMNLLPSEIPDELENEQGSVPIDTTCSREDIQDSNNIIASGVKRCTTDGDWRASKWEESPSQSKNQEDCEDNGSSPMEFEAFTLGKPEDNQELHNQEEPSKPEEPPKPCESPKKEVTPPRKKKSLFSYQTSTIKS